MNRQYNIDFCMKGSTITLIDVRFVSIMIAKKYSHGHQAPQQNLGKVNSVGD